MAYRSIPLQAAYCGAKQAIRGFTDALRCELLHDRRRGRRAEARSRRALAMTPARRATRARLAGVLYVCSRGMMRCVLFVICTHTSLPRHPRMLAHDDRIAQASGRRNVAPRRSFPGDGRSALGIAGSAPTAREDARRARHARCADPHAAYEYLRSIPSSARSPRPASMSALVGCAEAVVRSGASGVLGDADAERLAARALG